MSHRLLTLFSGASVNLGEAIKGYFASANGVWYDFANQQDKSGNEIDLSISNDPVFSEPDGKPEWYAVLTAADDDAFYYLDDPVFSLGTGVSMTCGGWVNLATTGVLSRVLSKGDISSAATVEYSLGYSNSGGKYRFSVGDGSALTEVTDTYVTTVINEWYFVVAVVDLARSRIGINVNMSGWVYTAFTGPVLNGTNNFMIGDDTGGARNWNGSLDGIFLVKQVLSDAELNYIYNSGSGRSWATL